jgi:hypothetical protein
MLVVVTKDEKDQQRLSELSEFARGVVEGL